MTKPLQILSCGIGVQSTTVCLMVKHGDLPPLDAAIFADTGNEPQAVYDHLGWILQEAYLPFPLYIVSAGNLAEENLKVINSTRKPGQVYLNNSIPLYIKNKQGSLGQLVRRCTLQFKIIPVRKKITEIVGKERIKQWRVGDPPLVDLWMGISHDESLRMKPSLVPWIENQYPLVDKHITRHDCLVWTREHQYKDPPRSSCVMCPYHNESEWRRLKEETPNEFAVAVKWEKDMQEQAAKTALGVTPYCHPSLKPLEEIQFTKKDEWFHGNLFSPFVNGCEEGYCGI